MPPGCQTYKVARLAETMPTSRGDEHALELARLLGETEQLREDLALRTRDFQDALTLNAGIQARIAELEAERPDGPTRPAPA